MNSQIASDSQDDVSNFEIKFETRDIKVEIKSEDDVFSNVGVKHEIFQTPDPLSFVESKSEEEQTIEEFSEDSPVNIAVECDPSLVYIKEEEEEDVINNDTDTCFVQHSQTEDKKCMCNNCKYSISEKNYFVDYFCTESNNTLSECNDCDQTSEKSNLKICVQNNEDIIKDNNYQHSDHSHIVNTAEASSRLFSSESNVELYLDNQNEKLFACSICGKSFFWQSHLKRHLLLHSSERPFKCNMCNKSFARKFSLFEHIFSIHRDEKPFTCHFCNKSFSKKSNLTGHLRIHSDEKPFKCVICNRLFTEKSNLTKHMYTHNNEKPFKCDLCHKSFSQKVNLIRHLRTRIHKGE